jgi:hypothetical protein
MADFFSGSRRFKISETKDVKPSDSKGNSDVFRVIAVAQLGHHYILVLME